MCKETIMLKKNFEKFLTILVVLNFLAIVGACFILFEWIRSNNFQQKLSKQKEEKQDYCSPLSFKELGRVQYPFTNSFFEGLPQSKEEQEKQQLLLKMIEVSGSKVSWKEAEYIYEVVKEISQEYSVDHKIILGLAAVETQFINGKAGDKGTSRGILQTRNITVTDYYYKTGIKYTLEDMDDIRKNVEVAVWAYHTNVYRYGVDDTLQARVIAYNTGSKSYKRNKEDLLKGKLKGKTYTYWEEFSKMYQLLSN